MSPGVKKSLIKKGELIEADDFNYDANKNLLGCLHIEEDRKTQKNFYYYFKDFFLEEVYSPTGYNSKVENIYRKKFVNTSGLLSSSQVMNSSSNSMIAEMVYKYDNNNHLISASSKNSQASSGQNYVYDKIGNLLTFEYDSGRNLYEYKYDERNNLIQESRYNSRNLELVKKAEYNAENKLSKVEVSDRGNISTGEPRVYTIGYEYW